MISDETLLRYPYWTIRFMVHISASDKYLGAVISKNDKPIALIARRLSNPQHTYIMTEK